MLHAVVLEHTLPDGTVHFDWMIEHPSFAGEHRLVTWRVESRPDTADAFEAERIGAHRAAYLQFEGPVSGGRGSVRRMAAGTARWARLDERAAVVEIRWSQAGFRRYQGRLVGGGSWSFAASGD